MLAAVDQPRVRAIAAELDTIRLGAPPFATTLLPEIREVVGLEAMAIYSLGADGDRWSLTRWDHVGLPPRLEKLVGRMLARNDRLPVFYDPRRIAPADRNRVVEARRWVNRLGPETWERSAMYSEAVQPVGLHRHDQLRALVCDGPALLAWFGGMHPEPVTARQHRTLAALVPAMKRRLLMEARLARSALDQRALQASLELLGVPAFVCDGRGRIVQANAAGHVLLAERGADSRNALLDALHKRANTALQFELTRVSVPGAGDHWLGLLRVVSVEARIVQCVGASVARWSLTPRQAVFSIWLLAASRTRRSPRC